MERKAIVLWLPTFLLAACLLLNFFSEPIYLIGE